jgi:hypothetical protein
VNVTHRDGEVLIKGFPCSSLPDTLSIRGPPQSLVFRTEEVWRRGNQLVETAEFHQSTVSKFLIRVSPSHSYNVGRAGLGWMSVGGFEEMCALYAVIMFCFFWY